MASAGLLKIIHSGLQDERLSLTPDIRGQPSTDYFFKAFLRAGRFTTEMYRVDFDNRPAFGTTARATLPRRGHLITRAFLVSELPDLKTSQDQARAYCQANGLSFAGPTFGWTNSIGHALVTGLELQIAGSPISTLDGRLCEILDEFHTPLEKVTTVNRMLGRHDNSFSPRSNQGTTYVTPLPFWFSRGDPAGALPIDAMGNDLVQIAVTFGPLSSLVVSTSITPPPQENLCAVYSPLEGLVFYALDSSGQLIYGLNGNPNVPVAASPIPTPPPSNLQLGPNTYILLEYAYLDKPEANRIRLADISIPIVQHYSIPPFDTKAAPTVKIPIRIPNPTKEIYFYCHRPEADLYNSPFLATRDLSGLYFPDISGVGPVAPWWPDAYGLNTSQFLPLVPAYSQIDSEPLQSLSLLYEGRLVRYATDSPTFFRSILPSFEQRKTPWHWKYFYHLPFSTQSVFLGDSQHSGEANLDKIPNINLNLQFRPFRGTILAGQVPSYTVYIYAETYNILRVYGGRAGLLFKY
jgi:hypothetical protein